MTEIISSGIRGTLDLKENWLSIGSEDDAVWALNKTSEHIDYYLKGYFRAKGVEGIRDKHYDRYYSLLRYSRQRYYYGDLYIDIKIMRKRGWSDDSIAQIEIMVDPLTNDAKLLLSAIKKDFKTQSDEKIIWDDILLE